MLNTTRLADLWQRHRAVRWGLLWLGWTLIGLFFTLQSLLSYASQDYELRYVSTLVVQLSGWYAWGLLAPLVARMARHASFQSGQVGRSLRLHAGACLAVAPIQVALELMLRYGALLGLGRLSFAEVSEQLAASPQRILIGSFDAAATYAVLVGIYLAITYYRKFRQREVVASRLEAQLAQAELKHLRMQLHPHFLFNTLNSISALITEHPEAAERMVARLSELLRLTLNRASVPEVPLHEEVAFIERYLAIEQVRFPDRLRVTTNIAADTWDLLVPNLLLQPLVENAVKHGIAPNPDAGHIRISAVRTDGTLKLEVVDDGPGLGTSPHDEGIGLHHTRARLAQRYGTVHTIAFQDRPGGGLCVTITIPATPAQPAAHG